MTAAATISGFLVSIDASLSEIASAISGTTKMADCSSGSVGQVRFEFKSAEINTASANEELDALVAQLRRGEAGGRLIVTGYASADDPATYNLDLAEARAEAVRDSLRSALGESYEFITVARGERHEEAIPGKDLRRNRRATVSLCVGRVAR